MTGDAEHVEYIIEVAERASNIHNLDEIESKLLPYVHAAFKASGVLVYVNDASSQQVHFSQYGIQENVIASLKEFCARYLNSNAGQSNREAIPETVKSEVDTAQTLLIYPLSLPEGSAGLILLISPGDNELKSSQVLNKLIAIINSALVHCMEMTKCQQQIQQLNVYMNVSSLLSQAIGLHQLLETVLYCCMDVTAAEAASVLLLDDEKRNFVFYQVEGPEKEILEKAAFPASAGIAGAVLQSQQPEIINDIQNDVRHNKNIDSHSGFKTRNMIVLPLTAGEEHIGILEIVNKTGGGLFSETDKSVLISIADEISFAIQNAKIFEYVANSYCKQRQGQNSCKGCQRPLGSWTPCVKYREIEV
jgi:GAF domain-containing protein